MPPKGFSWRKERDWDVHNAEEWLAKGLPARLSSETLNGRKASKKKLVRTMELETRNFTAAMPCRLPPDVSACLRPLQASLSDARHLVGVQDEPFDYAGMTNGMVTGDSDEECRREVMLSKFCIQSEGGHKLNVVFLRNQTNHMTSAGAVHTP